MTLAQMRTEVVSRGFDYLASSRVDTWLNESYHALCESDLEHGGTWPFLETTVSGTAPYTFTNLRQVISVTDSTLNLEMVPRDRRTILEEVDGNLATTGSPVYWYLTGEVLNVYPANTSDTLSIRYAKVPTDLSADSDTPLMPARYHDTIVDMAVIRAYKDSDNLMSAYALQNDVDAQVERMAQSLLFRVESTPATVAQTAIHEDA